MTREELVKALRKCGKAGMSICDGVSANVARECEGCPNEAKMASGSARECFRSWIEAADMLEKDAPKWISVEDNGLPEPGKDKWEEYNVCVMRLRFDSYDEYYESFVTSAMYDEDQKLWRLSGDEVLNAMISSDDCPRYGGVVTHYMPLPKPPKED